MKTYICEGIKYRPELSDDLILYQVYLPHLDKEWKNSSKMYIPRNKGYFKKIQAVDTWLKNGDFIYPPEVIIAPEGLIVVDGRHRLSVLRDRGIKEAIVASRSDLSVYRWAKKIAP